MRPRITATFEFASGMKTKRHYPDSVRGLAINGQRPISVEIEDNMEVVDPITLKQVEKWIKYCEDASRLQYKCENHTYSGSRPCPWCDKYQQMREKNKEPIMIICDFHSYRGKEPCQWCIRDGIDNSIKEQPMTNERQKRIIDIIEGKTAKTEELGSYIEQIPYEGLEEIGKIFAEGSIKYGKDNWKTNPTPTYRIERCRHAIRHLMLWANGDRSEPHLAKVAWFCVTEMWSNKHYGDIK